METKFTQKQIANWRRVRQNIESDLTKLQKINKKLDELKAEAQSLTEIIELQEYPVKIATGGFNTQEIFKKEVIELGVGPNGYPIRKSNYVLRYPDTILPPMQDTDALNSLNEEESTTLTQE